MSTAVDLQAEEGKDRVTLVGIAYPFRGGIAHYTTRLFQALEQGHHPVELIGFTKQYPSLLFPGATQLDESQHQFSVEHRRIISPMNPLSWVQAFVAIRALRARFVVFQWFHPFFGPCFGVIGILLRWFTDQKIVFICHNVRPHERHWVDTPLTWFGLRNAHTLCVHSEVERGLAAQMFPRQRIVSAGHPQYDQFHVHGISQQDAREKIGIQGRTLLCFGYVRPYKGIHYLLRALPDVLRQLDVTLVIAGAFYEPREAYEDVVTELDLWPHVRLVDRYVPNEEVEVYFSACDIVVCSYTSGSQSGVVQIAYSFGKPVICTRVGGLPEAVVPGKTGYVVAPGDSEALAQAIVTFYQSDHPDEFATNIARARDRFSWETLIETITEP